MSDASQRGNGGADFEGTILFIIALILLLGGGGGYYGYNRYGGSGLGGALGFSPIVIIELWRACSPTTPDAASKQTCGGRFRGA